LAVAGKEHAQTPWVQVESIRIRQTCERMPSNHKGELAALELVSGVHNYRREASAVEFRAQILLLVVVRYTARYLTRWQRHEAVGVFARDLGPTLAYAANEVDDNRDHLGICG